MDIEGLTLGQIREVQALCGSGGSTPCTTKTHSFVLGEKYLIRCVTHFQLGRLKAVTDSDLVLSEASWVADTGRFNEAIQKGSISENEPFHGDCIVSRGAIVDAVVWPHDLLGSVVK